MATTTISNLDGSFDVKRVLWTLTTADPTGDAVEFVQYTDLCWATDGATWGGATLTLQGSNDGTNWFTLSNAAGATAATFTADGMKQTLERPRYVRPKLTSVGVGASVPVDLIARRNPIKTK